LQYDRERRQSLSPFGAAPFAQGSLFVLRTTIYNSLCRSVFGLRQANGIYINIPPVRNSKGGGSLRKTPFDYGVWMKKAAAYTDFACRGLGPRQANGIHINITLQPGIPKGCGSLRKIPFDYTAWMKKAAAYTDFACRGPLPRQANGIYMNIIPPSPEFQNGAVA